LIASLSLSGIIIDQAALLRNPGLQHIVSMCFGEPGGALPIAHLQVEAGIHMHATILNAAVRAPGFCSASFHRARPENM